MLLMLQTAAAAAAALFVALIARLRRGQQRNDRPIINYRPIIGVLTQEIHKRDSDAKGTSYIPASYVKFLEGAGARVVPIRLRGTEDYYQRIFSSVNGLLLPGGDADIQTSESTAVARIFYSLAMKANNAGDYFPIWGACLGFQQLFFLTAGTNLLTKTKNTTNIALPLTFTPAAGSSRLFTFFPKDVLQSLTEENITSNFHNWSLSTENFSLNADLRRFYRVLSTNTVEGIEFISTIEAYNYPFYGVQWHPEKTLYEWNNKAGIVHSTTAAAASFYAARFFVSEAMKNSHGFSSVKEEEEALIYNFSPTFKGLNALFVQNYYFD